MIWKFTLSSSTFRLIEAAESLSTVDWKLLTDVRLLGLAESFSVGGGERNIGRGGGVKNGFHQGIGGKEKNAFLIYKPNVQYQNGYSIFMCFCVDLIKFDQGKCKRYFLK